ncbi:MAG: hypothetical protein A2Z34_09255 [Planctomycetes bacterium RBG_16_59_8]|nr:MAG: hypothetical protein A2Z34_09255 [Planctomycetes bacterium RBG_16_59_8]
MGGKIDNHLTEPPALPKEKAEAEKMIKGLIVDLGDDDANKRMEATEKLKSLGLAEESRGLVLPAVRAVLQSDDPEVTARAKDILSACHDFDPVPDVVRQKVGGIIENLSRGGREWQTIQWEGADDPARSELEPTTGYWGISAKEADLVVLMCESGVRELADTLLKHEGEEGVKRNGMYLLTAYNSSAASENLRKMIDGEQDATARLLAIVALGWSADEKSKKRVEDFLQNGTTAERRAAFLAVERSTDPAWIGVLRKLLESKEPETRYNAAYTLGELTGGKAGFEFNAFDSGENRARALEAFDSWWKANGNSFKIDRRDFIGTVKLSPIRDLDDITRPMPVPQPPVELPEDNEEEE